MENTTAHSFDSFTTLNNRILWFDGSSTVDSSTIEHMLITGQPLDGLFVDTITDQIRQYNLFASPEQQIQIKRNTESLSFEWNIPEQYQTLNIKQYLLDKLTETAEKDQLSDTEILIRYKRIKHELDLFEQFVATPILRTLIYIINTLRANEIVWGVGRGSSVASYVLYLIGVHDVDSVKYQLDIHDFLHE